MSYIINIYFVIFVAFNIVWMLTEREEGDDEEWRINWLM